jgi:predicted MPP superfamily phosphohydrolase
LQEHSVPSRSFIAVVLTLLALLHAYIGWRLLPALPGPAIIGWLGTLLLVASCALVPAGFVALGIRRQPLSDRLAWTGWLVMGLASTLLLLTLLRDAVLVLTILVGVASAAFSTWSALAVPLLAVLATLVGLFNARRLAQVVEVRIPIAGLPRALHGFSVVQISDIHVGPTIKRGYLEAIVKLVNAQDADMIAVTGDLVDGSVHALAPHTAPLAALSARHGAYFVTGNHEYYSDANGWIAEVRRLGLTVLMNEHVLLSHDGATVLVAGVTDYMAHRFDESHRSDPHAALAGAPMDVGVKMLLAHQPRSAGAAAAAGFDLQLSGHTHGGQFFPWNLFVPLQQPYTAGLNRMQQLWIYTSRGTGYWGPPKRLAAPSEITLLRLVLAD